MRLFKNSSGKHIDDDFACNEARNQAYRMQVTYGGTVGGEVKRIGRGEIFFRQNWKT